VDRYRRGDGQDSTLPGALDTAPAPLDAAPPPVAAAHAGLQAQAQVQAKDPMA